MGVSADLRGRRVAAPLEDTEGSGEVFFQIEIPGAIEGHGRQLDLFDPIDLIVSNRVVIRGVRDQVVNFILNES